MRRLLLLLFAFCLGIKAMCAVDPTISLSDISLKPGEQKTVYLEMQNADYGIVSMQGEFVIPEGITVSQVRLVSDRFESRYDEEEDQTFVSHQISYKNKKFIVTANIDYGSIVPVKGTSGAVISFRIKAAETTSLGNYQLKIVNVELGDTDFNPHYTECTTNISVSQSYSVAVSSADESKGTVTGAGSYDSGTVATVTATPITGYEFVNWTKGEDEVSKVNPYVFTVTEDVSLTANFKASTFTISYELDGGQLAEGDTNPGEYTIEDEDIKLKNPTKAGYTFAGWLKEGDETPSTEATIATGTTGNLKFTAQWTINQYTITFETDGGTTIAPIKQDFNTPVTAPADPTKEGYTFAGWDKDVPETMPAGDMTITAQWTINQYTITFDTDGGTTIAPIKQDFNTPVTAPANPTKEGYTFAGWDKDVPETMPAGDMTITAQWTINQYTITFDTDGGTTIAPIKQDFNTPVTAPADPTKEGYTFAGWDKDVPETMPAGDMTITAQWTINQYTITFDSDGGSEVASITADYKSTLTKPTDPTKEGYTFAGWSPAFPETMPLNGSTLKATWTPNQYTITFDSDGGSEVASITADYKSTLTKPADPTKEGYTFAGWSPEFPETMPLNGAALKATWTINQYTITFDSNGGTAVAAITQDYGTNVTAPADPTKEGYTFAGWDKAVPETMPAENMTLTAQWTVNEYTMTFVLDNGQENVVKKQNYGTELTAPENVAKTGYSFNGWSPEVPATVPASDKTFTAQWTINQYTITFDSNGGTAVAAITQDYGTNVTVPADPTKEGYTFAGWDKAVPETMPAENVTLKATWTPITYSISYDLDGGQLAEGDTNPASYTIESEAITLKNPTKDGYEFAGWTGTDLTQATMTVTIAKGSIGNRTYTATWTPASGIRAIFRDSKTVNVYTVNGTLVGRDMTVDEVIQLKHGIYVVNGKKIAIK